MTVNYLLLQTGDRLLLEDDSGRLLLEDSDSGGNGGNGGCDCERDCPAGGDTVIVISCPNLGLTVRHGPVTLAAVTALRGRKVPYSHISNTLTMPAWLGGSSKVDGISQWGRGDMKARYIRDMGDALGGFNAVSKLITAPSASPITLTVKDSIGEAVYEWMRLMDLDVRYQSCGRVDDPTNWDMIKRLCGCVVTDMSTSGETAYSPNDEGETLIKVQLTSPEKPVIIYPVDDRQANMYDETRFADYVHAPIVTAWPGCGYAVPAIGGAIYPMYMAAYGVDVEALTSGTPLLPHHPVSMSGNSNILMAVLDDGSVWWSNDSGKTFAESVGVAGALVVKVWNYSNILVGCSGGIYSDGYVYKSTDGGHTFEMVDPYNAVTGDVVDFAYRDGKVVYVLDSNGVVSMSEDDGETFIRTGTTGIDRPTSMIILGDMLIVGGLAGNIPVIIGSEDGGYNWFYLVRVQGCDVMPDPLFPTPKVKLVVEGCGVVSAFMTYYNDGALYTDVYRNVNWGASAAWERIWQDSVYSNAWNGLIVFTDMASACMNDLFAVGWIMGPTPLYVGVKFISEV